jgi:Activator of Hsp90 ATPase homolog 1-like protein
MKYDYWTGFSGLEDKTENYSLVTYKLDSLTKPTRLTVTRLGFAHEQDYDYSLAGWEQVLIKIKELAEKERPEH